MSLQSSCLARAAASSWLKEDFARVSDGKQAKRKLNKQQLGKSHNAKKQSQMKDCFILLTQTFLNRIHIRFTFRK